MPRTSTALTSARRIRTSCPRRTWTRRRRPCSTSSAGRTRSARAAPPDYSACKPSCAAIPADAQPARRRPTPHCATLCIALPAYRPGMPDFDAAFLAFPARELAGAALERATQLGASCADFRLERIRSATLALHDARVESSSDREDVGLAVRVVHEGAWGFASGIVRTAAAAAQLAEQAVATAKVSRVLSSK